MNFKTKISLYLLMLFVSVFAGAQQKKSPAEKTHGHAGGAEVTVNYSSPSVKGREIWGKLVPYGKVWRAGADEATTFETNKDLTVAGQKLPAGIYSIFIIPEKDNATVIFNKVAKQWGAYDYDSKHDQLRVSVKPQIRSNIAEKLKYSVGHDHMTMSWEKWDIVVPIAK